MVAVLYVMGVSSIKEFALPLMVGIICGAYFPYASQARSGM